MSIKAKLIRKYFRSQQKKTGFQNYNGQPLEIGKWYRYYIEKVRCATDKPSPMLFKKSESKNLIVFFVGGGLVWSKDSAEGFITAETLGGKKPQLANGEVDPIIEFYNFPKGNNEGLLSTDKSNPFHDWSVVMLNYGTGDFHIGQAEVTDSDGNPLHIQGYTNFKRCMDEIKRLIPTADKLLICGESAGGFGTAALAGDVMEYYPEAENITVCVDGSLLIREDWSKVVTEFYKAPEHIAKAVHSENITADWLEVFYQKYGGKAKVLFSCAKRDAELIRLQNYIDGGKHVETQESSEKFSATLQRHIKRLKASCPKIGIYLHTFPSKSKLGNYQHCTLLAHTFADRKSYGVTPQKWLFDAVNDKITDVGVTDV